MRMVVAIAGCALLGGCASVGLGGGARPPAELALEQFAYADAANGELRATVRRVIMAGDQGFIPSDPNWLQIELALENTSRRTLALTQVQEQLENGAVLASATGASELIKPPNLMREGLITTGIGVGGMAAGMLLFPPAALVGGALIAFRPLFEGDRVGRMAERLNRESLRVGPIAPGSTTQGWVFVPAVRGQTGLIIFYQQSGGNTESLVVSRR